MYDLAAPMDAVSLWQPHASLVAAGDKTSETRTWAAPRRLWGQPLAVQAAHRAMTSDYVKSWPAGLRGACEQAFGAGWLERLPLGEVVAIATLLDCGEVLYVDERHDGSLAAVCDNGAGGFSVDVDHLGDYSVGRWVWRLADIVALSEPIPARGRQRIWRWQPPPGLYLVTEPAPGPAS